MPLPPLIKDLLDASSYPDHPELVELRQTHISYLLFTPEFVYKIKKPVDFGFLNFSTLEARLHYCTEEVRLNRRLAPSVYLAVASITIQDGRAVMEGAGEAVEYAVKMRRLDEKTILEHMIRADIVTAEEVERVASAIAQFHDSAETDARISGFGSPESIKKNTDENFSQTRPFIGGAVSNRTFEIIRDYTDGFIEIERALFDKRVEAGFIRDCHGDIHAEHIAIDDEIDIIDCIEFNERFRYSDTVADAAFLSMDLDYLNRHDLSIAFEEAYLRSRRDRGGARLLDFYKCYRAYVRGKVEAFKYHESEVPDSERHAAYYCARRHFHLSALYASGGFRAQMIVVCGLSGTGKSTLARALAAVTDMVYLASDQVRKELAGLDLAKHSYEEFARGIYTEEFTEKTYRALIGKADALLGSSRSIIVDATFSRAAQLKNAMTTARVHGAALYVIECTSSDDLVRERLVKREAEDAGGAVGAVSDARWDIYLKQKETSEPIEADPLVHLTIDTGAEPSTEQAVTTVIERIFG